MTRFKFTTRTFALTINTVVKPRCCTVCAVLLSIAGSLSRFFRNPYKSCIVNISRNMKLVYNLKLIKSAISILLFGKRGNFQ